MYRIESAAMWAHAPLTEREDHYMEHGGVEKEKNEMRCVMGARQETWQYDVL